MSARFSISDFSFFARKTRTRFPFRYGIASMTEVPHLFVQARIILGGRESAGLASEGLPPKWFTKDPTTTFDQDLPEMLAAIGNAAQLATEIGSKPVPFFGLWRELYKAQSSWAEGRSMPPLLANLGVSLIERAVLDAVARGLNRPMHDLLQENVLELKLNEIYPELGAAEPRDLFPAGPSNSVLVRHTIGLADPITRDDIKEGEVVDDGLPQDLENCIRTYGLRAFKVKLFGDARQDVPRLRALDTTIRRHVGNDFVVTADGNENFKTLSAFRDFWKQLQSDPSLAAFCRNVAIIEQPVHRNHALEAEAGPVLGAWQNHPPLIIDESDGALGDVERALSLGYAGVSHKNCKGIVKSLAHAALLEHRRRKGQRLVLTAEDLCNLGPVALLQDLAMVALLGIPHVERNGHHYFRGLSMWPEDWQRQVLASHPDVYRQHAQGFPSLDIRDGKLEIRSINAAPFGLQPLLDPSRFDAMTL